MKIDIALSGRQMIKRMAEDYRVQFGRRFREEGKKRNSKCSCICVCLLHDIKALTDKSSPRLRVNVKSVLHYAGLEDLHLFT